MRQSDLINLFKFMGLTNSPSDAEALAALRRVNNMLNQAGKTWEDMYDLCKNAPEEQAHPELTDKTSGWEEEVVSLPSNMLAKKTEERFKQAGLTQFEANLKRRGR